MTELTIILISVIGICILLPAFIVWMISRRKMHEADKTTEIALAFLRSHPDADLEELVGKISVQKPLAERLIPLLWVGMVFTAVALTLVVTLTLVELASKQGLVFMCFCTAISAIIGVSSLLSWYWATKK